MKDVELINPNLLEEPAVVDVLQLPSVQWITPGIYISQKIFGNPLVRFVGERYESDYLQTVIVLNDDPESLLDQIFSIEQEMFKKFDKLRFDLRVRVIPPNEDINLIRNSSVTHIEKDSVNV